MNIEVIKKGFINTTGKIYDSEFLNLANISKDKIHFDNRTLFLNEKEKNILNETSIESFDNSLIIMKNKNIYSLIGNLPIAEYNDDKVKSHELVIPEIVQGMISNYHGYNVETAPVMLLHKENINLQLFVNENKANRYFRLGELELYIYSGNLANKLKKKYANIDSVFIGDGHHRLYSTSLYKPKKSVLSMLISFDDIEIYPIHRELTLVSPEEYQKAFEFLKSKFTMNKINNETCLIPGKVQMEYKEEYYEVTLIPLSSDAFWNNDVYRLNTQILSQAFRIFDSQRMNFFFENVDIMNKRKSEDSVYFRLAPLGKKEFIETAEKGNVLPPKTTFMYPKSPSFLVMSMYK